MITKLVIGQGHEIQDGHIYHIYMKPIFVYTFLLDGDIDLKFRVLYPRSNQKAKVTGNHRKLPITARNC